ncbi:hypothetical protein [Candidatus Clostridium helianthi]|uniref:Uncharacterized protein n=1 Tax=Candidatus Clostridium helianthi TaxID=3381660 RepID=A0ABW8S7U9_9CLOT
MEILQTTNKIEIYNDGILIIEGISLEEIKEISTTLLKNNNDLWEVELLNRILYTVNISLSTQEVA